MAKMFYNISETADKLGVSEDQIKKLVEQGKLQQFRDRDKLMFKREEVDELLSMHDTVQLDTDGEEGEAELSLDDTVGAMGTRTDKIELLEGDATAAGTSAGAYDLSEDDEPVDKGKTDALPVIEDQGDETGALEGLEDTGGLELETDEKGGTTGIRIGSEDVPVSVQSSTSPIPLADDTAAGSSGIEMEELTIEEGESAEHPAEKSSGLADTAASTGISVFDTQEVGPVDTTARTMVAKAFEDEEELSLESVGSGSGLLDLTREADDTSLGAVELLEDIAPAGESAAGTMGGTIEGSMAGTAATGIFEGAAAAEAGDVEAETPAEYEEGLEETPALAASYGTGEEQEVFGGLTMIVAFACLVLVGLIAFTGFQGQLIEVTQMIGQQFWPVVGGALALGVILFIVDIVLMRKNA